MNCPRSFEACHLKYEAIKPWRHQKYNELYEKPLDRNRSKRHFGIRPIFDRSVPDTPVVAYACRLHNTDVVIFHRDGRITLDASYQSMSTNAFARVLTPSGLHMHNDTVIISGPGDEYAHYGRWFKISHTENFSRVVVEPITDHAEAKACGQYWRIVSGTEDFTWGVVDRKRANAAYKAHGLPDFIAWARGLVAMNVVIPATPQYDPGKQLMTLADRSRWTELLAYRPLHTTLAEHVETIIDALRRRIVRLTEGCLVDQSCAYVAGYKEYALVKARECRWYRY